MGSSLSVCARKLLDFRGIGVGLSKGGRFQTGSGTVRCMGTGTWQHPGILWSFVNGTSRYLA